MARSAEELYELARAAYQEKRYRDALTILDRNWKVIYEFAYQKRQGGWLKQIRQDCRERLIAQQRNQTLDQLAGGKSKSKAKQDRVQHRRKP